MATLSGQRAKGANVSNGKTGILFTLSCWMDDVVSVHPNSPKARSGPRQHSVLKLHSQESEVRLSVHHTAQKTSRLMAPPPNGPSSRNSSWMCFDTRSSIYPVRSISTDAKWHRCPHTYRPDCISLQGTVSGTLNYFSGMMISAPHL